MSLEQTVKQGLVDLEILNCMIPLLSKPPEDIELDADNLEFISFLDSQQDQAELDLPLIILEIKQRMHFPKDYLLLEKNSKMHDALATYQKAIAPQIHQDFFNKQSINSAIRAVRVLVEQCFDNYNKLTKQYLLIHAHNALTSQYPTKPLLHMTKLSDGNIAEQRINPTLERIPIPKNNQPLFLQ